jgi:hypothetical protein
MLQDFSLLDQAPSELFSVIVVDFYHREAMFKNDESTWHRDLTGKRWKLFFVLCLDY